MTEEEFQARRIEAGRAYIAALGGRDAARFKDLNQKIARRAVEIAGAS